MMMILSRSKLLSMVVIDRKLMLIVYKRFALEGVTDDWKW